MAGDRYYGLAKVADMLDVHPKTIQKWVKQGKFPRPRYFGDAPHWREIEVQLWADQQPFEPPPKKPDPLATEQEPAAEKTSGAYGSLEEPRGKSPRTAPKRD